MSIDAFIFDLDGTLIDSELLWAEGMQHYLADRGAVCSLEEILQVVYGRSWTDIHRALTTRFKLLTSSSAQMAIELRDYYLRLRGSGEGMLIPTSIALLRQLALSHPVIIVSGSPRADIEEAVALMAIEAQVRFVLGAEDYAPGKPDPAGFLLGAKKLGVDPAACLVFEDSLAGVMSAKAAGMWCVALARANAHVQNLAIADWVVPDLAQFDLDDFCQRFVKPGM